jgi:hypothetical protein
MSILPSFESRNELLAKNRKTLKNGDNRSRNPSALSAVGALTPRKPEYLH